VIAESARPIKLVLFGLVLLSLVAGVSVMAPKTTSADQAYRTERLVFEPVGDAPELRAGMVVNSHSNGPQRYAHEQYLISGAEPNAVYQVVVEIYIDLDCGTPLFAVPTAVLETNTNGVASASAVVEPAEVAGLGGSTVSARWVLRVGDQDGPVAYQTACTVITLDEPPA
jgi:hypothetical protein